PSSPYAAAKAGADRLVDSYVRTYDLPAVILRPFNNYGPRQHLEKVVPRFLTSALLDEPLTLHGGGSAARDWLYVDDCVDGILAALDAPLPRVRGQVLNLGTGIATSVAEIAAAGPLGRRAQFVDPDLDEMSVVAVGPHAEALALSGGEIPRGAVGRGARRTARRLGAQAVEPRRPCAGELSLPVRAKVDVP